MIILLSSSIDGLASVFGERYKNKLPVDVVRHAQS